MKPLIFIIFFLLSSCGAHSGVKICELHYQECALRAQIVEGDKEKHEGILQVCVAYRELCLGGEL